MFFITEPILFFNFGFFLCKNEYLFFIFYYGGHRTISYYTDISLTLICTKSFHLECKSDNNFQKSFFLSFVTQKIIDALLTDC